MNTPRTDKFYDEVSDRESPDNGQKGWALPSKWSYEAIIDLVDFARHLEVESVELLKALKPIAEAYSDDPGTDDLYDDQPVSITLGMVRKARAAIKRATE